MRRLRSVRARATLAATGVVAVALLAASVLLVGGLRRQLQDGIDEALELRADDLTTLLGPGTAQPVLPGGDVDDDEGLAQLLAPSGQVVAATANLAGSPALAAPLPAGGEGGGGGGGEDDDHGDVLRTVAELPVDDGPHRLLVRPLDLAGGRHTLVVAASFEPVDEAAAGLVGLLAVGAPLLVALVAATTWAVVGRALGPVERIRARVAHIGGHDLQARVPEPGTGDEVDRLAATMNEMLARLEDSAERQQRFVADASHELRSPLTGIRAQLEVDLAHPTTADPLATERQVLAEVDRLQRLVADLLLLARHDAGGAPGGRPTGRAAAAVDLDDLVLREARRLRERGGVDVDTAAVSGAQVVGHADELLRVVRNLLDNAARHAARRVTLSVREDERWAELVVADDGDGIPPDQRDRLFDRFTRADAARARDQGGSGLGLAIAKALVTDHGGSLELAPSTVGARFVVRIPAAAAVGPP